MLLYIKSNRNGCKVINEDSNTIKKPATLHKNNINNFKIMKNEPI